MFPGENYPSRREVTLTQAQPTFTTKEIQMSLMKYKDVLVLAKEKINEVMAPLRAREMRKKAELESCKLDSMIATHEQDIQELASEYPIDFDKMIDALDELELTKRRKEQFEQIITEMFGE
jgi:hypothetical protein